MKTKKNILIAIAALLLTTTFFYWFQWRPSSIRKNCEFAIFSKEAVAYRGSKAMQQNNKYRQCLIRNGLAPESLFVNVN